MRIDISLDALRTLGTTDVTDDDLLTGGEDHALAFTIAPGASLPAACIVIGEVSAGSGVHLDGHPITGGHDHFA